MAAWIALVVYGLSHADEVRFLPRGVWVLLCVLSPVIAAACLAASVLWSRFRGRPLGPDERAARELRCRT